MTRGELDRLLESIGFGPPLDHWLVGLRIAGLDAYPGGALPDFSASWSVEISFRVRDRNNGQRITIKSEVGIHSNSTPQAALALIFDGIETLARHEVAEGFQVAGKRWRDPHE